MVACALPPSSTAARATARAVPIRELGWAAFFGSLVEGEPIVAALEGAWRTSPSHLTRYWVVVDCQIQVDNLCHVETSAAYFKVG
jgi:catalase (peroxidase I)